MKLEPGAIVHSTEYEGIFFLLKHSSVHLYSFITQNQDYARTILAGKRVDMLEEDILLVRTRTLTRHHYYSNEEAQHLLRSD